MAAPATPGHIPDEPVEEDEEENDEVARRQDDAFDREYANDHSWESLQEDEQGRLRPLDNTAALRARRQKAASAARAARIRRGMIRCLVLVVDLSRATAGADLRPSRLTVMTNAAKAFIRAYFDQNPLSQLALVVLRNGVAERRTDLSGSPERQIARLVASLDTGGDVSLQNALDLTTELLRDAPPYGHREALFLCAALSTCDPGDLFAAMAKCRDAKIRASVVGVSAEVYVCKRLADMTGGTYTVALGEQHLHDLLLAHAPPPPAPPGQQGAELVRMGFPQRISQDPHAATYVGKECVLGSGGYVCPRCKATVVELPCKCHVCGLPLVSSPHLARSYHHLFPVEPYEEVPGEELAALHKGASGRAGRGRGAAVLDDSDDDELQLARGRAGGQGGGRGTAAEEGRLIVTVPPPAWREADGPGLHCFGCLRSIGAGADELAGPGPGAVEAQAEADAGALVLRCPLCSQLFCCECDAFVHESLFNCPGCEVGAAAAGVAAVAAAGAAAAAANGGSGGTPPAGRGRKLSRLAVVSPADGAGG